MYQSCLVNEECQLHVWMSRAHHVQQAIAHMSVAGLAGVKGAAAAPLGALEAALCAALEPMEEAVARYGRLEDAQLGGELAGELLLVRAPIPVAEVMLLHGVLLLQAPCASTAAKRSWAVRCNALHRGIACAMALKPCFLDPTLDHGPASPAAGAIGFDPGEEELDSAVQRLAGGVAGAFSSLRGATERCLALSGGTELRALLAAVDSHLQQYVSRLQSCVGILHERWV